MKFCITRCSKKKHEGILPPDKLYDSSRIGRFVEYCKRNNFNWGILSAKYGLFFPAERNGNYNVTLESDKGCCLGIKVEIDGKRLLKKQSALKLKGSVENVKSQASNHSVGQVVFYTPNPKGAEAYLALLHFVFDNCEKTHSWSELLKCISKHGTIYVTTQLDFDP